MIFRLRSPRSRLSVRKAVVGSGILLLAPTCLWANPTGGAVTAGSATIAGQGTSAVIINQASNTAIINWQSFSINSGESTSFLQPGANSAVLNRVLGGGTSLINGTLSANGQVYLINGNGVIVGPGGVINANSFTASTRDITDANFLSGKLEFTGSSDTGVQNLGSITAIGGNVVLIGRTVDNEGTISAPKGTAGLVAGDDVLLAQNNPDGSTITVSPSTVAPKTSAQVGVKNGGAITAAAAELKAANGNIYAMAVQNLGTIRATTVTHQGGRIWLTSDSGKVSNSGTLDASATAVAGKGGTVTLKSATGTASHTGQILARGGQGGAGGNVDISGAKVEFSGTVDTRAPLGTMGNLLIDPTDVNIFSGGGTDITASTIDPSAIVSALNSSDVTISATNSISVNDFIDASGNANPGNLTLDAPTITLDAPIFLNGSLFGTATTANVGTNGFVQQGIDVIGSSGGTVNLAAGVVYDLSSEVIINNQIDLEGNGATLDAGGATRVLEIDGATFGGTVTLNNLVFTGGNGVSSDGAAGGTFSGDGGAILVNAGGTGGFNVSITNSTFVGNTADLGGAVYNQADSDGGATVFVENSTLTGNSASVGSALYADGNTGNSTFLLKSDTITMNTGGGAIFVEGQAGGAAAVTINDSILAGNTGSGGVESDYVDGGGSTLTDNGYNLYGQLGDTGGFPSSSGNDVMLLEPIESVLSPLGMFGGPTPTMSLIAGSAAIGTGDPAFVGSADQRGVVRGSATGFTDMGSDIGAVAAQFIDVQGDDVSTTYGDEPALTYTVISGPASLVVGEPMLLEPVTDVGDYPGIIGQGSIISMNPGFILSFAPSDLTITPRPITVAVDPLSKVYGSADPTLTYTATGLINGDTLNGAPSYEGQGEVMDVGDYPTTLGTLSNSNYAITLGSATNFSITPATLTYTADQVQADVGAEFPNFTGTVTGFVNDDTQESATTGTAIYTTTAEPGAAAGFYAVNGSGLEADNYVFAQARENATAFTIGNPSVTPPIPGATPGSTPAQAAAQPNTSISQAIAQTSTPPTDTTPDSTTSTDPSNPSGVPGGTPTPMVENPAPVTVQMTVSAIAPNEYIDSAPARGSGGGGGGQDSTSPSAEATPIAQSSSFNPDVGATQVTVGQTVTVGGSSGTPPPPVVQAQLNQILDIKTQDTLGGALTAITSAAASTADDQGGGNSNGTAADTSTGTGNGNGTGTGTGTGAGTGTAAATGATPAGGADQGGQNGQNGGGATGGGSTTTTASTTVVGGAAGGGSSSGSSAPVVAPGTTAMVAPGQTVTLSGGKPGGGPPPPSVINAFSQGFSSESRGTLAQAAGLPSN